MSRLRVLYTICTCSVSEGVYVCMWHGVGRRSSSSGGYVEKNDRVATQHSKLRRSSISTHHKRSQIHGARATQDSARENGRRSLSGGGGIAPRRVMPGGLQCIALPEYARRPGNYGKPAARRTQAHVARRVHLNGSGKDLPERLLAADGDSFPPVPAAQRHA